MNKLPDLPKQNRKEEAKFGIDLRKSLSEYPLPVTTFIELKQTEKKHIPFNCITPQQIAYANKISSDEGVLIRIIGSDGQPDYVWARNSPAYLGIKYPEGSVYINVRDFIQERDNSKRKSLTWERAREIATHIIDL